MGVMTTVAADAAVTAAAVPAFAYLDPLDADEPGDAVVAATRRGLTRLALVAAETGARFQREEVAHDPMAWLLAPRRLFGGAAAVEACLERDNCLRAVLLHGLSLGLDAEAAHVDALLADAPGDEGSFWDEAGPGGERGEIGRRVGRRQRLYSAVIVIARGGELVHLFHASVAPSSGVVRERIRARFGEAAAKQADIRLGVDLDCPATSGMLPPCFREMLVGGRRVRWSSMAGFDVTVEHRIPS